ncbi:MAG: aspartate ammonia-lyase [Thermoleophilia bacterium]
MSLAENRAEHDLLGDRQVPVAAYYGIHTLRAWENFPITGIAISTYPDLVNALAAVKHAAAAANRDLGLLSAEKAAAILTACEEVRSGLLHNQFIVDVIQGGAGTSANMNANEVIANRALEHLGHERGEYAFLHPLDDVNMGQSTNDVYPTAVKVALRWAAERLLAAMGILRVAFAAKAATLTEVVKVGRTQLQDAVPMTLGQEFTTYAVMIGEDEHRLAEACRLIEEVNLGGTAIGTQLNAPPGYSELAVRYLSELSGISLTISPDLIEATQDPGSYVQFSGVLKRIAVKVSKICNDLRLLSSGPRAGLHEINLPPVQAGSSMMPGKVNPVIPEVVNQIAFEIIGNDVTVSMAAEAGQLQLNAFEPIIAHALFESTTHLEMGCRTLAERCVGGITANVGHLRTQVENSIGLATALNPIIGYAQATAVAQEAAATGRTVYDIVLSSGLLSKERLDEILSPEALAGVPAQTHPPEREL